MDLGLNLPTARADLKPADLAGLARRAEELGYRSVWIGEHVVLAESEASNYFAADAPMPDPLVLLAGLATVTSTIRLGTGVCLPAQRNPVYLAKEAGTLDWLSGGRLDLGIGIGWSAAELAATGLPWRGRPSRLRDSVHVMRHLWHDRNAAASWPTYELPEVRQHPRPIQAGGPPVWIGGNSDAALRRVAEYGDGWYGFADVEGDDLGERIGFVRARAEEAGRDPSDVRITLLTYRMIGADEATMLDRLGVEQLVVSLPPDPVEELHRSLADTLDRLRATEAVS